MILSTEQKRRMKAYLLGRLAPAEHAEFEKLFYADNDLFEQLVIVEDEMILAYVRGELPEPERSVFEASYLTTPERREKVAFEKSLFEFSTLRTGQTTHPAAMQTRPTVQPQFFADARSGWLPASAVLLLIVSSVWLGVTNYHLRKELDAAQRQEQMRLQEGQDLRLQVARLEKELQQALPQGLPQINRNYGSFEVLPPSQQLPVTLSPGVNREAGQQQRVLLRKNVRSVLLQLRLENESNSQYQFFAATLEDDQGRSIWTKGHLAIRKGQKGDSLFVNVPAKLMVPGDYVLRVIGMTADASPQPVGIYVFRVVAR